VVAFLQMLSACRIRFFFFFQAEDGIRDATVTGVQTCALPISRRPYAPCRGGSPPSHAGRPFRTSTTALRMPRRPYRKSSPSLARSEERRVGKECGYGWGDNKYK